MEYQKKFDMMQSFESRKLPPESYRQKLEELANLIPDPVRKLRFLNLAIDEYHQKKGLNGSRKSSNTRNELRKLIEDEAESLYYQYKENLEKEFNKGIFSGWLFHKQWFQNQPYFFALILFLVSLCALFLFVLPFKSISRNWEKVYNRSVNFREVFHGIQHTFDKKAQPDIPAPIKGVPEKKNVTQSIPKYLNKLIWLVEKSADAEYYSNRLEIITSHTIENIPREYYLFSRGSFQFPEEGNFSNHIAGILYHASESDIFEYRPEMTQSIKKYSRLLIRYLNKRKAYHYFIDRFGKVYRLIREDHAAFHGGNSIWADDDYLYLNLNHAFIGICFEGKDFQTIDDFDENKRVKNQSKIIAMERSSINEAQLKSGKELTDWLRVKYKISQENCIPHGLASVNPYDQLIGHHLDLSHGFPFGFFELSNKYNEPIPAITDFGFTYDNYFVEIFKGKIWPGIGKSDELIKLQAKKSQMSVSDYRKLLNKKFKIMFEWIKKHSEEREQVLSKRVQAGG